MEGKLTAIEYKKQEILHRFQDINLMYNECVRYDELSHMLDELIEICKADKWIPLTEKYPPKNGPILICDMYKDIYIAWLDDDNHFLEGFWEDKVEDVRAWMPLPEPYKAEKGELI